MHSKLIRPPVLKMGDKVALIAPSSPPKHVERIDFAANYLRTLGFDVAEGKSLRNVRGYLAGTDDARAFDVNHAFANPDIKGIFCLRGGYGASRILDKIDYANIRKNPKFFCGYSDTTALHIAINQISGVMTFHTPAVGDAAFPTAALSMSKEEKNAASRPNHSAFFSSKMKWKERDEYTQADMNKYITNEDFSGEILNPHEAWHFLTTGTAAGLLCGGNLAIICATMGTPYEINTHGKIIFIEDVNEAPFRIDRMLHQLKLAGKFDVCTGVVFGDFANCEGGNGSLTIPEIIADLNLSVPVLYGLKCGHCMPTASLPLGAMVRLCSTENSFTIL